MKIVTAMTDKDCLHSFNRCQFLYTALFCEENIWQLLNSLKRNGFCLEHWQVLLITNKSKSVALLNQNAAPPNKPIVWDYHVILLAKLEQTPVIIDFDTRLPFVSPVEDYVTQTFIEASKLSNQFRTSIRLVPALTYLKEFYSDRKHMLGQIDASEFPDWPLINTNQTHHVALMDYLDLALNIPNCNEILQVNNVSKLIKNLKLKV